MCVQKKKEITIISPSRTDKFKMPYNYLESMISKRILGIDKLEIVMKSGNLVLKKNYEMRESGVPIYSLQSFRIPWVR